MIRILALALLFGLVPSNAFAEAAPTPPAKIFLSSNGSDANDGSRVSPKRSLQAGHDAVAAGGNIVILDTAGYGSLSITKSVAVTVPQGVSGFVTTSSGTAITINGAAIAVSLQGLIIEGGGTATTGIYIYKAAKVAIEDCLIRSVVTGVNINTYDRAMVEMHRTTIKDVTRGFNGGAAGSRMDAKLVDVVVTGASELAYFLNGSGTYVVLTRCEASNSQYGIALQSQATVYVDKCVISNNTYAFYKFGGAGDIYTLKNNAVAYNTNLINSPSTLTPLDPQ